jgi:hypothetical protein
MVAGLEVVEEYGQVITIRFDLLHASEKFYREDAPV